jgi:hypothetical protein
VKEEKYLYNGGKDYKMVFGYIYQWDSIENVCVLPFSQGYIHSLSSSSLMAILKATLKTIFLERREKEERNYIGHCYRY